MITKLTKYRIEQTEYTADELRILRDAADAMIRTEMEIVSPYWPSLRGIYFSFYNQLPKWIAERAKANWSEVLTKTKDIPTSLISAVNLGFVWGRTEGNNFWCGVTEWLLGEIPHPPFPPDVEKPASNAVYLGRGGEFETGGIRFVGWAFISNQWLGGLYNGLHHDYLYAAPADSEIVKLNYGKGGAV